MAESIVLSKLQNYLACNYEWGNVSRPTFTKYRRAAEIAENAQSCDRLNAEWFVAALMFGESDGIQVKRAWRAKRALIAGVISDSGAITKTIEIKYSVYGRDLPDAILRAGGRYVADKRTLQKYASILSERSKQDIKFDWNIEFSPEVATAFARLTIEMKGRQALGGQQTAAKRFQAKQTVQVA